MDIPFINKDFEIPIPPDTCNEPVLVDDESVVFKITVLPVNDEIPTTVKFAPINNDFPIATPPAVVKVPPFVELVASVVLLIDKDPENNADPIVLLVLVVVFVDVNNPATVILFAIPRPPESIVQPVEILVDSTVFDTVNEP